MTNTNEPTVVINGKTLTSGQSMTLRVALASFKSHLYEDGLGSDHHGVEMVKLYLERISDIEKLIYVE